ncbi:MAG: hypothetical protein ACREAY_09620 [Nitrososphaera sp.]|uniref:hypothetical protein n=1 Tax=Nitrososphaera sp. TaxID=1971748 RepID=UPI003D6FE431
MSEAWIRLLVKYKGKCSACGKEIPQGDYALWSRASKAIKHVKCETVEEKAPASVMELKCFICGKTAGCASCSLEADCDRPAVSQACICEGCMSDKKAYDNYQQAFLAKMAKVKM